MTTPGATPQADPPGRRTGWLALTTTHRGAAHIATKLPNQDAVVAETAGPGSVVAAVADGHGHWRHARSARGSELAVSVGCQTGQELASLLAEENAPQAQRAAEHDVPAIASQISDLVRETLVPAVVQRWRKAVLADVAANPFTDEEQESRQDGDDATVAYGSTLLLAVALQQWLILAQIGDGDIIGVRADGGTVQPVPDDPQLDGRYTTSLCGPAARSDFRIAVLDIRAAPLAAVMLATDGYGNAQIADQWADAFSKDLAEMLRERDDQWLAGQLPMWAARCASSDGSADDTTVALLLGPPGLARTVRPPGGPAGQAPERGSEETTVPAMVYSATIPSAQIPAGQGPVEPVTLRLPAVEPDAPEADAADPVTAGPAVTDQVVGGPGGTEPGTTEPVPAEPLRRGPGATEPGATEPVPAEPLRRGPDATVPAAIEPTAPEPVSTEPPTADLDARKIARWRRDR